MAFKVGQESIAGGYIGSSSASAIYIGAVLAWSAATPTPPTPPTPSQNKVLVVEGILEAANMNEGYSVNTSDDYSNVFDFNSSWNDVELIAENTFYVNEPYSGTYENNTITIEGPFSSSTYNVLFTGGDGGCYNIVDNTISFSFSSDSATVQSDWTTHTDEECVCSEMGGTWDGNQCIMPEPDPCEQYGSQEECDCVQGGGYWDGVECHYDEPPTFEGLEASPTTIGFYPSATTAEVMVKSSEYWEITNLPSWLSASTMTGDSGEIAVTFENISQTAETSDTITITSMNYNCTIDVEYSDSAITFVDGVRSSSAPSWDLANCLDTGIFVTGDDDTRFRIKYYGAGVFSDRIVGFDSIECDGNDNADFRYFPDMADAATGRIDNLYGLYNDGQYYDVTFGNLFVYDNLNSTMIASAGTFNGVKTDVSIRIDMSVNWIKEVIIMRNINGTWTDIADFKAAEIGGVYGLFNTIGNNFLTKSDIIDTNTPPTPQQSTYLIMDISNIPSDGQVHTYTVYNDQTERMSVLEVDMDNMTVNYTDDPDGLGVSFSTGYDDQGDISQGWIRWELYGPFNGQYYIDVDGVQLQTAAPYYDGSEMVAYVDVTSDTMDTYSCYGEWDCVQNNPLCTWDPNTGTCDCGGV